MGQTAATEYDLAVRCVGAVVWHLKYCLMDEELLSLRSFVLYKPVDVADAADHSSNDCGANFTLGNVHMVCLPILFGFCFTRVSFGVIGTGLCVLSLFFTAILTDIL